MSKEEKGYDDREIVINREEKFMLSELTERERDIFFEGVKDGFESAGYTILCIVAVIAVLFVIILYLI